MQKKPSVSFVIPVYNEEAELVSSVSKLRRYLEKHLQLWDWNIIIADNASSDATLVLAGKLSKKYKKISVLHLDKKGRGRAVKKAWESSTADVLSYMDVDLSTGLKHILPLIDSLKHGYDIAIGSRNAKGAKVEGRSFLRTMTSKGYIFLIKLFFWIHFTDAQCGFKAVTRNIVDTVIPYVKDNEWFFDTELLVIAEKCGYRIYEEPVTWIDNPGSTVRVLKTAQGDIEGLKRLFTTRPWEKMGISTYARN